ncbi:MAG: ATP-binding cassette domain-containing protein [Thermodesulfobacteriota bacterium]
MSELVLEGQDLEYEENGRRFFSGLSFSLVVGQGGLILSDLQLLSRRLLQICATLEQPARGWIRWLGRTEQEFNEAQVLDLRRRIGWVHRESRLVSNMSLLDNLVLGLIYHRNISHSEAAAQVKDLLERLGLYDDRHLRPAALPFALQRLAVYARELVKRPRLFLLETPVLDLDQYFDLVKIEIEGMVVRGEAAFLVSDLTAANTLDWVNWVLVLTEEGHRLLPAEEYKSDEYGRFKGGVVKG